MIQLKIGKSMIIQGKVSEKHIFKKLPKSCRAQSFCAYNFLWNLENVSAENLNKIIK